MLHGNPLHLPEAIRARPGALFLEESACRRRVGRGQVTAARPLRVPRAGNQNFYVAAEGGPTLGYRGRRRRGGARLGLGPAPAIEPSLGDTQLKMWAVPPLAWAHRPLQDWEHHVGASTPGGEGSCSACGPVCGLVVPFGGMRCREGPWGQLPLLSCNPWLGPENGGSSRLDKTSHKNILLQGSLGWAWQGWNQLPGTGTSRARLCRPRATQGKRGALRAPGPARCHWGTRQAGPGRC